MAIGEDILTGVYNAIILAGIPSIDAGSTFRRERPERLKSDPDRICVVVLGKEQLVPGSKSTMDYSLDYPVLVVLGDKNALTVPRYSPWFIEARDTLIEVLHKAFFLGLNSSVNYCRINAEPKYDAIGFEQANKVNAIEFVYTADRNRS